jgi:hypothetical protein
MNTHLQTDKSIDRRPVFSALWIFATLNYLYCDVMSLMDPPILKQYLSGIVNGMSINGSFLLGAAILMEIPIGMVILSRVLKYKANRLANMIAGLIMTIVQTLTMFMGKPAPYYIFCSTIEILTTAFIAWYAWKWVGTTSTTLNSTITK